MPSFAITDKRILFYKSNPVPRPPDTLLCVFFFFVFYSFLLLLLLLIELDLSGKLYKNVVIVHCIK